MWNCSDAVHNDDSRNNISYTTNYTMFSKNTAIGKLHLADEFT